MLAPTIENPRLFEAFKRGAMRAADPRYAWAEVCRPDQQEPAGDWRYWIVLAGRGYGKTRIGAEWVRRHATSGRYRFVNIIGATADDARDIMIEGESGILEICPDHERPRYVASKRQLIWPNGCKSLIFTADEPERLRGKQHEKLWCDEAASWRVRTKKGGAPAMARHAWTQAMLGLRLGDNPQALVTTTPKPLAWLRRLIKHPHAAITRGTTYDNRDNLAPEFFEEIITEYEGTYLGRQELEGHLLAEAEGALWRREWIDRNRLEASPETLARVVIGVDPPGGAAECGLVAAGIGTAGNLPPEVLRLMTEEGLASQLEAPHYYTLGDWSEHLPAAQWGAKALRMALHFKADRIVAEKNFGGDMVLATIAAAASLPEFQDERLPPVHLVTASRGKAIRAEPWSARAQQGREHHCGDFDELEDELCTWEPGEVSPNRLDAKVWALAGLEMSAPAESGKLDLWG